MPMGIVNDSEFEHELERTKVPFADIIVDNHNHGRSDGDNNVPDSLRKIIGETSKIDGPQDAIELASKFGISRSSVSAYANGSTSTSSYDKQPNLNFINEAKGRIAKRARKKLNLALHHITDDKLAEAKPEVLANVARSMSAIVKEMEPELPKEFDGNKTGPTFIFYSPQIRDERHYDIINARD